jgi:hypothetical protein
MTAAASPPNQQRPWWKRIEWIDVVVVLLAIAIILAVTAELWLPHYPVGPER